MPNAMIVANNYSICFVSVKHEVQKEANLSEREKSEKDKKKYVLVLPVLFLW